MKKLIAALFSVVCLALVSASTKAPSQLDKPSTDVEQSQALVQRDVSSLPGTPSVDSEEPQPLLQRGVCNLTCTSCIIGQPCPKDPDTGHNQFCVANCP